MAANAAVDLPAVRQARSAMRAIMAGGGKIFSSHRKPPSTAVTEFPKPLMTPPRLAVIQPTACAPRSPIGSFGISIISLLAKLLTLSPYEALSPYEPLFGPVS